MTDTNAWDGLPGEDRYAAIGNAVMAGNRAAWDDLVAELTPLVWHVARSYGLDIGLATEVVQTVWLALLEHVEDVTWSRVPGWLVVTTRREAVQARNRMTEFGSEWVWAEVARTEREERLWAAFRRLSQRCQDLLRMTVLVSGSSYADIAAAMRMPVGSIGPTRSRCLARLRVLLAAGEPEPELAELSFLTSEPVPAGVVATLAPPVLRTFPVSIYLAERTEPGGVEVAVEDLLRSADVTVVERDDPVIASWYRRMRVATRTVAQSPGVREAAAVTAHMIESRGVLANDATVTATLMQNLGPVLTSLQSTKDAVLRVGAILIVKVDWVVAVHQLTSTQQLRLDHQPRLLTSPRDILRALELDQEAEPKPVTDAAWTPAMLEPPAGDHRTA